MTHCLFFFLSFNIDEIENITGGECGIFSPGTVVYLKFAIVIFTYLHLKEKLHTSLAVLAIQNLCRQCHPVPLLLDADFLPNTGDSWASGKGDRTASTVQRHCIPRNGTCLKNYHR